MFMNTQRVFFLFLATVTPVFSATWVMFAPGVAEGEPPSINVIESDADHTVVEITVPGMWVDDIDVDGDVYQLIEIPGYLNTGNVGLPSVPFISELVAIPGMKDFNLNITDTTTTSFEGYTVFPTQKPTDTDVEWEFYIDEDFYNSDSFFPEGILLSAGAELWRDLRVTGPGFIPVKYSPSGNSIEVTYYIQYELIYGGTSEDNTQEDPDYPIEQDYALMYRESIINYDFLALPETGWDLGDRDYLIITKPELKSTLGPFKNWLDTHGISCFIVQTDEIPEIPGKPVTYNIWSYIKKTYTGYDLKFVLLVGGFEDIPPFIYPRRNFWGSYPNVPSDHYYACIWGYDCRPDISIGRIPGHTPSNLNSVLNRIIGYKNGVEPGVWPANILLAAHKERCILPARDFIKCKDKIESYSYGGDPIYFHKRYGTDNRNADLKARINMGCGLVNYKGHGNYLSWANWNYAGESWTASDIGDLNHGDKQPIVFNGSCSNADLYRTHCLADDWLNLAGAVGSIGATTKSVRPKSNDFDRFFVKAVYPENRGPYGRRIGRALDFAKCDLIKSCSWVGSPIAWSISEDALDCIRKHLLLGDPSMGIRRGSLTSFSVNHESSVAVGASTVHVEVLNAALNLVENAVVCVYKEGEVHEAYTTAADGLISFDIDTDTVGEITVTATKESFIPYEGIITVEE